MACGIACCLQLNGGECIRAPLVVGAIYLPARPQGLEQRLGGSLGLLRCMARCLLVAGAKSYTHLVISLERYYGPLKNAVDAAGPEVSARATAGAA